MAMRVVDAETGTVYTPAPVDLPALPAGYSEAFDRWLAALASVREAEGKAAALADALAEARKAEAEAHASLDEAEAALSILESPEE